MAYTPEASILESAEWRLYSFLEWLVLHCSFALIHIARFASLPTLVYQRLLSSWSTLTLHATSVFRHMTPIRIKRRSLHVWNQHKLIGKAKPSLPHQFDLHLVLTGQLLSVQFIDILWGFCRCHSLITSKQTKMKFQAKAKLSFWLFSPSQKRPKMCCFICRDWYSYLIKNKEVCYTIQSPNIASLWKSCIFPFFHLSTYSSPISTHIICLNKNNPVLKN